MEIHFPRVTPMNDLASKISYHRTLLGLNQTELAKKVGITTAQISRYETGKAIPRPAIRAELAKALGIKPSDLVPIIDKSWVAKVKARMKELRMSQFELAEKLNCSQSTIANWFSGNRLADAATINKILEAVGLPILDEDIHKNTLKIPSLTIQATISEIQYPIRLLIKAEARQQTRDLDFRFLPNENKPLSDGIKSTLLNYLSKNINNSDDILAIINQLDLIEIKLTFRSDENKLPES